MNAPIATASLQRDEAGTVTSSDSPRTLREALPFFLRHGSPRVLVAGLTVAVAARLWVGDWSWWDLAPIVGLSIYWPIQEWLIHVFILHFKPITVFGRSIDFRVPREHRAHHREPWNVHILFIPFHTWLYTLPLVTAIWFTITPTAALALTGLCAHMVLAMHYEWVHFLSHTRYWPRTRLYQRLWRNHRLHHFKNEHYWFGVTMLSADHLFRTQPAAKDVPASATVRALHSQAAA